MIDTMPETTTTEDIRQEGDDGRPRILIRSYHSGGRFVGADVHVGDWRVNHRRYTTVAGASRRAAREMQNTRTASYGATA